MSVPPKRTRNNKRHQKLLYRQYNGHPPRWQLVKVLKTGFNLTLRLPQISEIYCSLVHLQTSIYCALAFLPSDAANTRPYATIMALDAASTPKMSLMFLVLRYISLFLSITIFGVFRMISRMRVDVFLSVHALHVPLHHHSEYGSSSAGT